MEAGLPKTPTASTGGGRKHYLFKADRRVSKNRTKLQGLYIDVKTRGGAIIAAPSLHASRNTPFQGIAGDGAKLALWGLYRAGFRAVAFVHDEVLIELPIGSDHAAAAKRIDRILCETMEELTGSIPIACEYALSDPWYKAAEAVFNEKGQRQLWKPTLEISH